MHGGGDRRRRRDYSRRAGAEIPMILRTEIYATACIVGGIVHATAHDTFHLSLENSAMMGMVVTGNSSGGYSLASEAADVCPGR
nr:hypothetical protein [Klebsiella pneumoniae subsp. pneumoniae]